MAAITYDPGCPARQRPTTLPVSAGRAPSHARSTGAGASSSRSSAVVLVLVMAQAGAALGGSTLAAPERRPASAHVTHHHVAARRLAVVDRAAARARATTPGRRRRARRRPATAPPLARVRRSSGRLAPTSLGTPTAAWAIAARAAVAAARGPSRPAGGSQPIRWRVCAVRTARRRRQGRRLAPGRRRRGGPAPAGVPGCGRRFTTYERVEELPLVVVKRSGEQGAVRPRRSCGPGSSARWRAVRSTTPRSRRWRRESRRARARRAPRSRARVGLAVLERLRGARPGLLRALRVGLQGLRRPRRLRARGRGAPEDHAPESAAERPGRRLSASPKSRARKRCNDSRVVLVLSFPPPCRGWGVGTTRCCGSQSWADSTRSPGTARKGEHATWHWRRSRSGSGSAGTSPSRASHPYDTLEWERREARIPNFKDGTDAFFQPDVEFPVTLVAERHQHRRPEVLPRHPRHRRARVVAAPGDRPRRRHDHDVGHAGRLLRRRARGRRVPQRAEVHPRAPARRVQLAGVVQHRREGRAAAGERVPAVRRAGRDARGPGPIGKLVEDGAVGTKVFDAHGLTQIVAVKANGTQAGAASAHEGRRHARRHRRPPRVAAPHGATAVGRGGRAPPGDQLEWHRTESWGTGEISLRDREAARGLAAVRRLRRQYTGTNRRSRSRR